MTTPPRDPDVYFESVYRSQPPDGTAIRAAGWDIGRPQPPVVELARTGAFGHRVLDAGCGTGDNALHLAARGHLVTGVDAAETAIEHARGKAARRGLAATFAVCDARDLPGYDGDFDSVVDSGLFHTFGDTDRSRYVAALRRACAPGGTVHILAVSDAVPPGPGPRRIAESELRESFSAGWVVEELRAVDMLGKLPGSDDEAAIPAWLLSARRTA
ncbi:cyclopropane fatty-acyl-phospholipid synthase-like methyltransferase [Nocardia sp. GAS34]|uniref:class I SAM-dependent methyltransferase n=1 Tax=unclassified Nocardia TaxID=2637762 RepID=UPI003D19D5C5